MLLPDSMPCRLGRHGFFVELLRAVRRVLHVEIWATDCTRTSPSSPPSTNFPTPNGQPRSPSIKYSKTMLFPITGFCHEYIRHLGMDVLFLYDVGSSETQVLREMTQGEGSQLVR